MHTPKKKSLLKKIYILFYLILKKTKKYPTYTAVLRALWG